ncbi:hypothetical protein ADK86_31560 [Streptomyces sp. NRRL F-5755]|uniref:hypothetical protein n=1 Tax=Streptomyces sp. NRRL F-5755 TaxID=1519475 RepID=UPI0006AFAD98|nr:hypothetical protein [Streptomyces sp. NRRL F-5755]KOT88468.1 hypothetical protein ADK86_31560 [Streptomyces sp. NRRL F-5755]
MTDGHGQLGGKPARAITVTREMVDGTAIFDFERKMNDGSGWPMCITRTKDELGITRTMMADKLFGAFIQWKAQVRTTRGW